MQVAELVGRFTDAAAGTDPMGAARVVLEDLAPDINGLARHMWDPDTLAEHPLLDWTEYEAFAQRASRAASAPLA